MYCLCVNVYCHLVSTQLQLTNVSTSHTRHDFRKYVIERRMCVVSLQLLPQTFLIRRIIHRNIIINVRRYSCYVTTDLVRFKKITNLHDRFSTKHQISNLMKIRPVGTELFRVDRHDEANNRFSQKLRRRLKPPSFAF
jgi:hypothetical protein